MLFYVPDSKSTDNDTPSLWGSALFFLFLAGTLFMGLHLSWLYFRPYIPDVNEIWVRLTYDTAYLIIGFGLARIYFRNRQKFIEHKTNEERLKLFIKHTPAAVAMLDKNMRYLEVSDRWLRDYHIDNDNIAGISHYDVFNYINYTPEVLEMHQRCLSGETIRREDVLFPSRMGGMDWVNYEMVPWRDSRGKIGGLIFFSELITSKKEAALQLEQSEARYQRVVRGSNDGIWDWEVATDHVYYSPQVHELLGHRKMEEDPHIEGWLKLIHPDDKEGVIKAWTAHLEKRTPSYRAEFRLPNAAGDYIWLEGRGQAEWDEQGNAVRVAGSIMNISERKRLEELKTEFVYVVTHELRSPLTALKGALDMLPMLLGKDLPARVQLMLDLAMQGSNRLMLLINDLMEVGHVESGAMRFNLAPMSVGKVVQQSIDLNKTYADKYEAHLVFHDKTAQATINVDEGRFLQVMTNLLSNAAKYSPQGGEVTVTAKTIDNKVTIAIQDRGQGISAAFQHRIFQKFAQGMNAKPGSGLGLNITKTMVEKMGGTIWFESEEGKGTTFFVQFPVI